MIIGLIFLVLIGVAIINGSDWRLQRQNTPFVSPVSSKTPLDIVKERYARGEINREEYDKLRYALS